MNLMKMLALVAALALSACATTPLTPEERAAQSADFMARNALRAGTVTTPSGLQYRVVRAVDPALPHPNPEDTVVVNYEGRFPNNGPVFDSSYERNEPAEFPLNRVIRGWTEGVGLMRVGEEYQLFIPPALAYGERGAGEDIPPNQALVFRVELLAIQRPDGAVISAP